MPDQTLAHTQSFGDLGLAGRLPHQDHDLYVEGVCQEPRQVGDHPGTLDVGEVQKELDAVGSSGETVADGGLAHPEDGGDVRLPEPPEVVQLHEVGFPGRERLHDLPDLPYLLQVFVCGFGEDGIHVS